MESPDRRAFVSRSWKALAGVLAAETMWGTWDMLKPAQAGAFGGIVKAGAPSDFPEGTVRYFPNGRFYVASYEGGLQALYQKCPHLGCRVPFCDSSKQFECPCHGSVYNIKGEYLQGPAPRGMDRFPLRVEGKQVLIDTGTVIEGPAQGVLTGPSIAAVEGCGDGSEGTLEDDAHSHEHQEPTPPDQHVHDEEASHGEGSSPSPDKSGGMDMGGMDMGGMDMGGNE